MGLRKREAHLALDQLANYRNHLDSRSDAPLISALNRLLNVFQSRLFLALLDIQEFYESTLLDPGKNNDEKTAAALDVALRWENISSPSLVASTIDLRRSNSSNELSSLERPRSLYQLNLLGLDTAEDEKVFARTKRLGNMGVGGGDNMALLRRSSHQRQFELVPTDQSTSTLSFPMPSYTPSNGSPYQWTPSTGVNRLPDSAIYSGGPDQSPNFQSTSSPSLPPLETKRPVAKPRQKRLKRPKSTTQQVVPPDWSMPLHSEGRHSSNVVLNDRISSDRWGPLSHLPITTEVILDRTSQGFGFSIAGGRDEILDPENVNSDILVTRVSPGGPAHRQGGLQVNDRILSVNGISLIDVSHDEAVRALQLAGDRLRLVVERKPQLPPSETNLDRSPAFSSLPPLNKPRKIPLVSAENTLSPASTFSRKEPQLDTSCHSTTSPRDIAPVQTNLIGTAVTPTDRQLNGSMPDKQASKGSSTPTKRSTKSMPQRQRSLETAEQNVKTPPLSGTAASTPGYRRSRKNLVPSGFPAFSWCTGLHKPIGCAGILTGGHRGSQGSSHQQTVNDSSSDRQSSKSHQRFPSGSRPVPVPPPGPVVVEVLLTRGTKSGLGFSIAGGVDNETVDGDSGIFVTKLTPGGVAETDGRLAIGDRIVQVNNVSLVDVTHEQAVNALKQAGEQVQLILVKHPTSASRLSWNKPVESKDNVEQDRSRLKTVETVSSSINSSENVASGDIGDEGSPQPEGHSDAASSQQLGESELEAYQQHGFQGSPGFLPTGRELLEEQMAGLIDYAAAASVADLISRWPRARMVTLYRSGKPVSPDGTQLSTPQTMRRLAGGSLGLNIVGGDGSEATFISQVQPDKPAALSRRVFVGDRVLAVNGIDVSEHGHEKAAAALRNATDRVDLVLVYSPEEYAEFEKCYSRQLEAVGHKLSSKSARNSSADRGVSGRSKEKHRKRSSGRRRHSSISDKTSQSLSQSLPAPGTKLFVRCQVDYDPASESHQTAPKKAFGFKSGDLFCIFDWSDSEWWQAQRLDPTSTEQYGPVGLLPSRIKLQRREKLRNRHVNFLARSAGSVERMGSCHLALEPTDSDEGNNTPQRTDQCASATSITSGDKRQPKRKVDQPVLSYITVAPVQLSLARPVVILGYMKDHLVDELLSEFPDQFGTAVPYTTRACRRDEMEGREYHFVVSREIMVADIAAQRYLEAGEYKGNLYGTHLDSVFEIAELGLSCLLDVGGPALKRLEAAGLPAVAILILPETFASTIDHSQSSPQLAGDLVEHGSNHAAELNAFFRSQSKIARLLRHFSSYLTAIITTDDFDMAYQRIKELISENSGPLVWLNTSQPIP